MKRLVVIILIVLSSVYAKAQSVNLSTPRATIETFLVNLDSSNYNPKMAAEIIQSKGLFRNKTRKVETVEKLMQILVTDSIEIDLSTIPNDSNYVDPNNLNKHVYVFREAVYLEKEGDNWYLSSEAVEAIHKLHEEAGLDVPKKTKVDKKEEVLVVSTTPSTTKQVYVDLSSPRATLKAYLENTEENKKNYNLASRIINRRHLTSEAERMERIEMLDRFMAGSGVLIDLLEVPEDPNFVDSLNLEKPHYEITYRFPELYLEKVGKTWYLSNESVDVLPEMYRKKFPFGSDRLFKYLPQGGKKKIGTLEVWQYIGILLLTLFAFVGQKLFSMLASFTLQKIASKGNRQELSKTYIMPVVKPLAYSILIYVVYAFVPILMLPVKVGHYISITVAILGPLFFIVSIYRFMDVIGLMLVKRASKSNNTMDDMLAPIMRKGLKTFVVIIGIIFILQNLNIDIVPLMAGLSIGGLALALAAQDTIKQFFGSLMIFLDKPFQVGHWISSKDGIDGTVEEVGIRATRIRTFSNSLIYVPNGQLSDSVIDNHGMRHYRRFKTDIAVTYDTPPELIEVFIEGLRKIVMEHPHTRKDMYHIYLNNLGSHSIDILFYIFFRTPSWGEELAFRQEIIMSIIKLAHKIGVQFAFPTQTLHVENLPGQSSLSKEYGDYKEIRSNYDDFFKPEKGKG